MPPPTPTARPVYTPADLTAAAAALDAARREWERFGLVTVGGDQVEAHRERAEAARAALRAAEERAASRAVAARYHILRAAGGVQRLFGLDDRQAWVAAVFLGAAATAAVAPLVLLVRPPAGPGAAVLVGTFVLTTAAGLGVVLGAGAGGPAAAADRLRAERAAAAEEVTRLAAEAAAAEDDHLRLAAAFRAQAGYVQAVDRHRRLDGLLTGERYQLQTADWRAFRGAEWVAFVGRVFGLLGYRVEAAGPGQGADLVVHGKGRRVAVQAVGAADAVGPGAVQAAFAGKTYFGCGDCLVVTTGRFTGGAVELAEAVGCGLIDADRVPELIDGRIL